ncbi:hypothetical protein [Burkholderia gladioli]|uniref:hypothetical protein n=1 Tax=Burkholderia gladioli TaxID=28095 RepID=UPI003F68AC12
MALVGMCRRSGRLISGVEHLVQSIGDILSTRKGTDLAGKAAKGLVARCAKRRTRRRVSLRRWLPRKQSFTVEFGRYGEDFKNV